MASKHRVPTAQWRATAKALRTQCYWYGTVVKGCQCAVCQGADAIIEACDRLTAVRVTVNQLRRGL